MRLGRNTLLVFAIIAAVALCNCDAILSSYECSNDNGCQWEQSQYCNFTQSCNLISDQVSCLEQSIAGMCQWTSSGGECNIQPTACQLRNVSSCNYPESCLYSPPVEEKCVTDSKHVVDCDEKGKDEQTCHDASCLWEPSYFACATLNKCEKDGITNCDTQFCDSTAYSCSLLPDAEKKCNSFTDSAQCTQAGCVYNETQNYCSIPTCTAVNNACNSAMCTPATGTCQTKSSACTSKTQDTCVQGYCTWKEYQATCTYSCSIDDCKNKKSGCQYIAPVSAQCNPNLDSNQCLGQSESQCQSSELDNICTYQSDAGTCSNVYKQCKKQPVNACSQIPYCQQFTNSHCVGESKGSYGIILKISFSLIGFLFLIL